MRAFATLVALASAAVPTAVPAAAQDLYDKDGVQLWTSARLVTRDAATCRVLEDRYPEEGYEKLKVNEGQPLHVWRMDLTAANYSGKTIGYLRASVDVRSEWPPCTNWDWEVLQDYPGGVDWASGILSLQRVSDLPAGEELRETMFLLVFHDQEPGFGRWTIDYNFAEAASAASERGAPGAGSSSRSPARPRSAPPSRSAARSRAEPPPSPRPSRQPGETFRDTLRSGGSGPEMVVVPAGSFRMGCVSGVRCGDAELPVHEVTIPQAFAVSKHEVTFAQWEACVSAGGCSHRPDDEGWGRGNRPVVNVSWDDAQEYVSWLSTETGAEYRLLSESEWEYAARGGTSTAYHFGNGESALCRYGNHADRSTDFAWRNTACSDGVGSQTAPVGSFSPNIFGLHDMHGNVWELVEDCWNAGYTGAPSNGSAWRSGECSRRVVRGGSWLIPPRYLRSASRDGVGTGLRDIYYGFRVSRTLTP